MKQTFSKPDKSLPVFVLAGILFASSCSDKVPVGLIDENFRSRENFGIIDYKEEGKLSSNFLPGRLTLTSGPNERLSGVYCRTEISGNFQAEAGFSSDDAAGIVLIASKNGVPDFDNYTMFTVNTRDSIVYINQYDCQNGKLNVHDPGGKIIESRYESKLDGKTFSVPFTSTNGKIMILHESLSNTFHFYYGTRLEKWGITSDDWMELAPQYSWLDSGQPWFVALVCRCEDKNGTETVEYKYLKAVNTNVDDRDDSLTGFSAVKRSFSWSGFSGEATVVSFGGDFDFDRNIKFVIWDRANNAPVWRLTNQFLLNFEFFECGDSVYPGCHEAMSDRQRHGQSVEIVEDNAVRKVVRWRGIPLNPQYNYSGEHAGSGELPYYEETWTFYPDGTGTRQLRESPRTDISHSRQWGPEIIEPMPIGGSLVEAGDLCNSPALSVFTMKDSVKTYFPPPAHRENVADSWNWPQVVYDCHFKEGVPDIYIAYNQSEAYPDTWTGLKIETQISWHNTGYNFSHWPVGREPYGQNTNGRGAESRSYASYPNEVTHTSLVSAGFYRTGLDYKSNFLLDASGRKYRKHVMLTGVSAPYDYESVRDNLQTWLDPGKISTDSEDLRYVSNDRDTRILIFEKEGGKGQFGFTVEPGERALRNPAIKVLNWKGGNKISVSIDDKPVRFASAVEGNSLLLWIRGSFRGKAHINVTD